jgi:polyphosphate glucokinase
VLVVDVGGTHVKILATGHRAPRQFASGPTLTARPMVSGVRKAAAGWEYDAASIGYPGPVLHGRPVSEPHNLAPASVGFDFEAALGCPARLINDAAMQEPMGLGHLPYRKGTYEDYVGVRGLERAGKRKWRRHVEDVVERLVAALEPDDVVLGGGNARKLRKLTPGCRAADNANAFRGGFRPWPAAGDRPTGRTRGSSRRRGDR